VAMLLFLQPTYTMAHKNASPYTELSKYRMNIEYVSVRRDFSRSPQKWSVLCRVGSAVPERIWKKNFGRAPPLFGSKSTISRFGERFRTGRYSLVSLLFYSQRPPCPAICKSGGTCPRAPWSRRHWVGR